MTPEEKLQILGDSAKYDISCCGGSQREAYNIPGIYYASGSNNKVIPILKTLFTNECKNDCLYCANRISRDVPRVRFTPDELANLFISIYQKHFAVGLFLSSGIAGSADKTLTQTIKTVEILRYKYKFWGYVHLKILPGAHSSTIKRAIQVATNVSVNIETPTCSHMQHIAQGKDWQKGILDTMDLIKQETKLREKWKKQTTQFVVGADNETDQEIVKTMSWLRDTKDLHRTYFSPLKPVAQNIFNYSFTKLAIRNHRLYQVEFLQRLYGFSQADIYFSRDGNLPNDVDPKLNYALHNLDKFPIEINKASYRQLLHIPGIGKITARNIIEARREGHLTALSAIKALGGSSKRSAPFILINGKAQGKLKNLVRTEQLPLGI